MLVSRFRLLFLSRISSPIALEFLVTVHFRLWPFVVLLLEFCILFSSWTCIFIILRFSILSSISVLVESTYPNESALRVGLASSLSLYICTIKILSSRKRAQHFKEHPLIINKPTFMISIKIQNYTFLTFFLVRFLLFISPVWLILHCRRRRHRRRVDITSMKILWTEKKEEKKYMN